MEYHITDHAKLRYLERAPKKAPRISRAVEEAFEVHAPTVYDTALYHPLIDRIFVLNDGKIVTVLYVDETRMSTEDCPECEECGHVYSPDDDTCPWCNGADIQMVCGADRLELVE